MRVENQFKWKLSPMGSGALSWVNAEVDYESGGTLIGRKDAGYDVTKYGINPRHVYDVSFSRGIILMAFVESGKESLSVQDIFLQSKKKIQKATISSRLTGLTDERIVTRLDKDKYCINQKCEFLIVNKKGMELYRWRKCN